MHSRTIHHFRMEKRESKQDIDDIETLIDMIPSATSQSPHPYISRLIPLDKEESESFQRVVLTKFCDLKQTTCCGSNFGMPLGNPSNVFMQFAQGSSSGKITPHGSSVGGQSDVKNGHQTSIKLDNQESSNMPYKEALTSVFGDLSFKGALLNETYQRANHFALPDRTFLLKEKYPNYINSSLFPSPQSPNALDETNLLCLQSNGSVQFNLEMHHQQTTDLPKLDNRIIGQKAHAWQSLAHQMNCPKILETHPTLGNVVQDVPHQQQYFSGVQYSLPQMHLQESCSSCNPWFHIEKEHYFEMCNNCPHSKKKLEIELSESQIVVQAKGNATNEFRNSNIKQSYTNAPHSCQYEYLNKESDQNYDSVPKEFNFPESTLMGCCTCHFCTWGFCGQGASCQFVHRQDLYYPSPLLPRLSANCSDVDFDKVRKQKFPKNILARKNCLSLVKAVEFNCVGENEPLKQSRANRRVLESGQLVTLEPQKCDSVYELTGRIYCMAKDQYGCRLLQRKLTEGTPEDIEEIFQGLDNHIIELMTHPFGNYLVQKLLEVCSDDQRTRIIYAITTEAGDLVRIACNIHGTRVAQRLIETVNSSKQVASVVSLLKPGIVNLMKNANGYHVANQCLKVLMPGYLEFLFEAAIIHCVELAKNRHGCCVLNGCLDHFEGDQRHRLISEINSNALILSQDPFGNYVVQHVLELEVPWATSEVLDHLEGNYGFLSKQKFSSNVVEKCLESAGDKYLHRIIQEFMDNSQLDQIMQNQYGNFVIQAILNHAEGALHVAFVDAMRPHIPALRASSYGKKVLSCRGFKK